METFFVYLLKASAILGLFYAVYQLFLREETLFKENRGFLLLGILSALIFPLITIPVYVEAAPAVFTQIGSKGSGNAITTAKPGIDLWFLFLGAYYIGIGLLLGRFCLQLFSLRKIITQNVTTRKDEGYVFIETSKNCTPFSFFNYIVYNPSLYTVSELQAILEHEKAHCSQKHSIDILISHIVTIILWINPLSWLYRNTIRQNLEFLADASATSAVPSVKKYQYALLKASGTSCPLPIVNHFYNSLIKKRIVMLQKSESRKRNVLKATLVIPLLALFLFSFNTREVYIPANEGSEINWSSLSDGAKIEIKITKDTTDDELEKIKKDMAKEGVDFSYTAVRNGKKEITNLSVDMNSKKENGKQFNGSSSFDNDGDPIDPVMLVFDTDSNFLFMGNDGDKESHLHTINNKMVWMMEEDSEMNEEMIEKLSEEGVEVIEIREDMDELMGVDGKLKKVIKIKKVKKGADGNVFIIQEDIKGDGDTDVDVKVIKNKIVIGDGEHIEIHEGDGEHMEIHEGDGKLIKIHKGDGELHKKHVKVIRSKKGGDSNVFIMKNSDDDEDIEVIHEKGNSFFFIDSDAGEKPLYMLDGKVVKEKKFKELSPDEIATINVYKGDKAIEKYGKKAKDGVVEITTKKNKK